MCNLTLILILGHHGLNGPLPVSSTKAAEYKDHLTYLTKAAEEMGLPVVDFNGASEGGPFGIIGNAQG